MASSNTHQYSSGENLTSSEISARSGGGGVESKNLDYKAHSTEMSSSFSSTGSNATGSDWSCSVEPPSGSSMTASTSSQSGSSMCSSRSLEEASLEQMVRRGGPYQTSNDTSERSFQ